MCMDLTDSDLDDLLRSANPFPNVITHAPSVISALDDLLEPLTAQRPRIGEATRRRRRELVATVAATGILAVGGVAAATSSFSPVSTATPDFAASVRAATADLPLPPGDNIDNYIPVWQHSDDGVDSVLDRNDLRVAFSYDAVCAWQGYWLQEHAAGNSTAADDALRTLQAIPTWPGWGTNTDSSVRNGYRAVADAAAADNPAPVRQLWTVNCTGLPQAWATK